MAFGASLGLVTQHLGHALGVLAKLGECPAQGLNFVRRDGHVVSEVDGGCLR